MSEAAASYEPPSQETLDALWADDPADHEAPAVDLMQLYLKQIGRVPLLKAEQEVELAQRIEAGLYAGRLLADQELYGQSRNVAGLREEGETDEAIAGQLQALATDGEAAKRALLEANLRLVVSVVKRYQGKGANLLDLIQEGNLGLVRAVEKFDYTKGYKFSTYATWWIRQAVSRNGPRQSSIMYLPAHVLDKITKLNKTGQRFLSAHGREPTPEELAEQTGLPLDRVVEFSALSRPAISLDAPADEDFDSLDNYVRDGTEVSLEDSVMMSRLQVEVAEVLDGLSARQADILRWRYGLIDGQIHTLDDTGQRHGVTRERVRQIETELFKKIRAQHAWLQEYL